jgi:hypothetical protein
MKSITNKENFKMYTFSIHHLTNSVSFFLKENSDSLSTPQMKKIAAIAVGIFATLALLYFMRRCCPSNIKKQDYPDGSECEGIFDEFSKFIEGKKTTFEGDIEEGSFNRNRKLEGQGTITLADGTVKSGHFIDGELRGEGTVTWANGAMISGYFINGLISGKGKKKYPDGTVEEGFYERSQLQGYGKITRPDGTVEEGLYDHDRLIRPKPKLEPKVITLPKPHETTTTEPEATIKV